MLRQEFKYFPDKNIAIREIHLPNSRRFLSSIRLGNTNLNDKDARSLFEYSYLRMKNRPEEINSSEIVHAVDLFCGCGGMSLGAREACNSIGKHFLVEAALDKTPDFLRVYKDNFPNSGIYEHKIQDVIDGDVGSDITENEQDFLKKISRVDLLLAGPPCQGHSNLNNHTRRKDDRNRLYDNVARFIEIARPEHVMIENVPAIIYSHSGEAKKAIETMHELEYKVDSGIVNLATIGVPQKRKRHLVIASRSKQVSIEEVVEKNRVENDRTVRWAIEDIQDETPNGNISTPSRLSEENMKRIRYLHENDVYVLPNWLRPPCHRKVHRYPAMYGRIRYDKPAQTITSGFLSPGQGRNVHPSRMRTITPHEAARLQFFPDFFDFSSARTRESLSQMIGNAVPMTLTYIFSLELLS